MKKTIFLFGIIFFISGCACANNSNVKKENIKKNTEKQIKSKYIVFRVTGTGVAPCNGMCNVAQAKIMARRAAILNAYEQLAERIYGINIDGSDKVKAMITTDTQISSKVTGVVKGAKIENEEFKDGIYSVTMSVSLDAKNWNNFINYK